MNGFRNSSRNGQVWRWQRTGHRAVNLEIRGSGWRLLRRGVRPPKLLPGRTGDDLPGYAQNDAGNMDGRNK